MDLYSLFIYLLAGVVKMTILCFFIILLHYLPSKVPSVLVLFVIFGGNITILVYG